MKKITELTEEEAKEILKFVYPERDVWYNGLQLEPKVNEDGSQQVTFQMRPIVGIIYFNEYNDRCVLHFDNHKTIFWLYKNGYDVLALLEDVQDDTKEISKLEDIIFGFIWIKERFKKATIVQKKNFTPEYIISEIERLENEYYNL